MRSESTRSAQSAPSSRSARAAVLLLALLWLAPKLPVLIAPRADLLGEREVMPYDMHGEEYARGDIAVEVMQGPILPLIDYQWTPFFGGSLVFGLLAIPFFAVLGPNVLALKLVPLAFGALTVAGVFLLLDRIASRRAAWLGGLLMALAPPGYTALSTIAWGTHASLNGLIVLALFLYARIQAAERARRVDFLLLGAVLGFAVYFGYAALIAAGTVLLFLLARERRFLLTPGGLAALAGFAAGFAPWLVYNLRHDFSGLALYGASFADHAAGSGDLLELPRRFLAAVFVHLPSLLFFRDLGFVPGELLTALVAGLLAVPLALGFARAARGLPAVLRALLAGRASAGGWPAAAIVPVYLVLVLGAYASTDFFPAELPDVVALRYVALAWPPAVILIALGLEAASESRRRAAFGLVALVAAFATAGTLGLVDPARRGVFWNDPAYKHPGHGRWIVMRYATEPERVERAVSEARRRRPEAWQDELFLGMARALRYLNRPGAVLEEPDRSLAAAGVYRELRERLRERVPERCRAEFEP